MISENYKLVLRIINIFYTNGSKEYSNVGCAVISDSNCKKHCVPDGSSIITPEAKTVDLALDFIRTCDTNNIFIIFSDSLSVLKAMEESTGSKTLRWVVVSYKRKYVHKLLVNRLLKPAQEKVWLSELTVPQ